MTAIVDQPAVIDNVAGEKDTRRLVEQADTARRASGRVDLETAIAEVDYVAIGEETLGGRRADPVALG